MRPARPCVALVLTLLAAGLSHARPRPALPEGAQAFVGARVVVAPGRVVDDATIVVRDGVIESVKVGGAPPPDARVREARGLTIWPAFIDANVAVARLGAKPEGAPKATGKADVAAKASPARSATGHENPLVHPELDVLEGLTLDAKAVAALRAQGFATVLLVPDSGVVRGRGVVLALGEDALGAQVMGRDPAMQTAFDTAPDGTGRYPDSVMGATALLRQALLDAAWQREALAASRGREPQPEADASLEALADIVAGGRGAAAGTLAHECRDVLDALRAGTVAREQGLRLRLVGSGDEYRRLADVKALGAPVVLPVSYPDAPPATDDEEWLEVPLATLRHWDLAPDDARFLHEAGVAVSLTSHRLEDVADFDDRVRTAIERGLPADVALAMVTTAPAKLLGIADRLGTIERGKLASFVVARGGPFEDGTEVREVWVAGRRHVVSRDPEGVAGKWTAELASPAGTVRGRLELQPSGSGTFSYRPAGADDPKKREKAEVKNARVRHDGLSFELEGKAIGREADVALDVRLEGQTLSGASPDGVTMSATRLMGPDPDAPPKAKPPRRDVPRPEGPVTAVADALIRGATVWTCGPDGILADADVLVRAGRIAAIGKGLVAPAGVPVVSGSGRHVTPGLIDAHSHSAIVGGVNEGTNSCTAEVRIGDVVNSETVDTYRQLAGGLTTANLLHGSANCMGGQSQVIKLRWGAAPEAMKFEGAKPAIKFALGENVKQSNWGEKHVTRFPQTRMGVEQFMRTKFLEAMDYRDRAAAWKKSRTGLPPRRDLQLETLVEILEGRRSVHCHSYRQDEILMLMRVAEELGFRVGTFQHVLEGYKVADEMAAHGAMASCFTDWWGYKFEVYDAIPQDGTLMAERGVVVSYNSDSTELARRMNLEAAKAVKWGGVKPEEALLFVTLNPAKQLGVEDRVGSLEVGKDADLVVWTGDPLSPASRVEQTYLDGKLYFDRAHDARRRQEIESERVALIARVRESKDGDGKGGSKGAEFEPAYWEASHGCVHDEMTTEEQP